MIRRFQPEDTAQVQAIFAAGMRWYPEHQPGQPLNPFIEGYIAAAIADDLDPAAGMQATFIDGKSCFFVAVGWVVRERSGREGAVVCMW